MWSACAWSPTATGRGGSAERRGNVGGRTADDSFEVRTDTAAAGQLARHLASGDVPTPTRPVARPGSPLPSARGPFLVGAMRPVAPFERYFFFFFGGGGYKVERFRSASR